MPLPSPFSPLLRPPPPLFHRFFSNHHSLPPYFHTFKTGAKKRWEGEELKKVLEKEMSFPGEYFERAFGNGRVKVNGEVVGVEYCVREGDQIEHICHIHEPLISSPSSPSSPPPIKIIYQGEEMLVVAKPGGIPVLPSGFFHHNSLLGLVKRSSDGDGGGGSDGGGGGGNNNNDKKEEFLFPVHRIDREVSGLVLFAKNKKKATEFAHLFSSQLITKEYLCLVEGHFPSSPSPLLSLTNPLLTLTPHSLELDQFHHQLLQALPSPSPSSSPTIPGFSLSLPLTSHYQDRKKKAIPFSSPPSPSSPPPLPKETTTDFFLLATGKERKEEKEREKEKEQEERKWSLILARPHQGRFHQIRAHLSALGFPIIQDTTYGASPLPSPFSPPSSPSSLHQEMNERGRNGEEERERERKSEKDMEVCPICRGEEPLRDASSDFICLHGWRYSSSPSSSSLSSPSPSWSFVNDLPTWFPKSP